MTRKEFQERVIDASFERAVLVDFWAPWCGPCQVLTPVLDNLAADAENWTLVKVNTEESREVASDYRIMSIPNVKVFYQGNVLDEFVGALPAGEIRSWLKKIIPDKSAEALERIEQKAASPFDEEILPSLRDFITKHPKNKNARFLAARHSVLTDPEQAIKLLQPFMLEDELYDSAINVKEIARLMYTDFGEEELLPRLLSKARTFLSRKEFALAVQTLIDATSADRHYADDMPRKVTIALFQLLGNTHPVTRQYRRNFDMVLY